MGSVSTAQWMTQLAELSIPLKKEKKKEPQISLRENMNFKVKITREKQ